MNELKGVVAKANSKDGSMGLLLNDPKLYRNLESTTYKLNILLDDFRTHPKRYVNVSVFGGKKDKTGALTSPLLDDSTSSPITEKIIDVNFLPVVFIFIGLITFHCLRTGYLPCGRTDTVSIVNQVHSDRLRFQKIDSVTQLQMLAGNVVLQQDNTKFYCDSAVINKQINILEAFGKVHINDADSIHTYSRIPDLSY